MLTHTQPLQGIFISGTGTHVGKSIVTAALLRALWTMPSTSRKNIEGFLALKPVQTGCLHGAASSYIDANVYTAAVQDITIPPPLQPRTLHHFALAASPHLAATEEHKTLNALSLCADITACSKATMHAPLLIEGAGGLCVPLNASETTLDLIQELRLPVLLVMDNILGALNHTLLSMDALRKHGIDIVAIVCTQCSAQAKNTDEELITQDNIHFLRQYAPNIPLYTLPHIEQLQDPCPQTQIRAWTLAAKALGPLAKQCIQLWQNTAQKDPSASTHIEWDKNHLWHPYTSATKPLPVYKATHAKGVHIYLQDKQKPLIDGMSSWWCAVHGYGHKELIHAAQAQAAKMSHIMFGGLTHAPAIQAAQKLLSLLPKGLTRLFWADSGSVAVEVALKMALQYQQGRGETQRTVFLSPRGGYYGDTLGAMSVCDPINGMHSLFTHVVPQHIFIPRPQCRFEKTLQSPLNPQCLTALEEAFHLHGSRLAAFVVEPVVQGAGGMWFYDPRYLQHVAQLCKTYDVLLIFDEIATGFGRTGKMFAADWAQISPDICCVGKALTGGFLSLAATACSEQVAQNICADDHVFMHGPTFMANALACAVAEASLDIFARSPWQENVLRIEQELEKNLASCAHLPGVADVRVLGAIGVVEMQKPVNVAALQAFFVKEHVWIRPFANLIYVMPPYIASNEDIACLTKAITKSLLQ